MDELSRHNRQRWNDLAAAGVQYSRPWLDLDGLAAGGGQQSAAFGLLGADVTVFDLSDEMLARDRTTAVHYGLEIATIQGDVRDMSTLAAEGFDVVWQGHSLSFITTVPLRPSGLAVKLVNS